MRIRKLNIWLGSLLGLLGASIAAPPADPEDTATDAAQSAISAWGSAEGFSEGLSTPSFGEGSIFTLDGSASFSQPLSCQSTSDFVRVLFGPGSGGEISPLSISQDLDMDGIYDVSQTLPFNVSGVCSNGVISCNPGTWDSCDAYAWGTVSQTDPTLKLFATAVSELHACACVNDACGVGLVALQERHLGSMLGGAIGAALQTHDARFAVSHVQQAPFEVKLSGQNSVACDGTPSITYGSYMDDPAALVTDGTAASASNPMVADIQALESSTGTTTSLQSCTMQHDLIASGLADDVISISSSDDITIVPITDNEFVLEIGRPPSELKLNHNCTEGYIFTVNIQVTDPTSLVSVVFEHTEYNDHSQMHIDGAEGLIWHASGFDNYTGKPSGDCQHATNFEESPNIDLTSLLVDGDLHQLRVRTSVGEKGQSYHTIRFRTTCNSELSYTDGCAAIAANETCALKDEVADGVVTYANGVHTGLSPIPSERTAGLGACEVSETLPWWRRDREYSCLLTSEELEAESPNLDRATYVYAGSTETEWVDRRSDGSGGFIEESGALTLGDFKDFSDCESSCKVSYESPVDGVHLYGTQADNRSHTVGRSYRVKTCGISGSCPIEAGETLVQDCSCLNEFGEAVVGMQALRLGGMDSMCTTGEASPW